MATVFEGIRQLLSLKKAAQKSGRQVREEDLSIFRDGCFVVEKGEVVWVGKRSRLPTEYRSKNHHRRNLKAETVLPAFVECHTHSVFSGHRAAEYELRQSGVSYQEIARQGGGILSTVKATRKASLPELSALAQSRAEKFLRQGVTTLEVKSGYGLRFRDEVKMLEAAQKLKKLRVIGTYLGAHSLPAEFSSTAEYIDQLIARDLPRLREKGIAQRVDIFVEEGFFNIEQARRYLLTAKELGFALTVHADQLSLSGAGRLAVELEAQSADHLVQVKARDIQRLAKSSTTAVLLPAADYYLKMAYPPARQMIDRGVRVALATDFNPGSSPTQDLAFVGLLARQEMKMSLPEVLAAYTLNAAHALGLGHELGSLEPGKQADFITSDLPWQEFFYHVGESVAQEVWRQGKRVWSSGQRS